MTRADLHRLVDELPADQVDRAAHVIRLVRAGRLDPDQAWFWTPEWQAGEQEVDADLASGKAIPFDTDEAFIAHLRTIPPADVS